MSNKIKDIRDLLDHEVQALYSAENLITAGLPRMIQNASSPELKQAFETHLKETERQIERLEEVADILKISPDGDKNLGMAGIIAEGEQVMHKDATPEALDAALICGAQKVEHYEIAGYGTAVYLAHELGFDQVATILESILAEEKKTNEILNQLAKNPVNPLAE